ncbi:ATP-binding cassette, subfamily B [Verrucomicrobium sp. GAS474]|uniref:ABC transporter ATP-binding protein n=1 Tax=Verrucomicrobium sp. GAS474 TaxID=1882831 RepID=UPI00087C6E48|nr:ABC transporter ATP-binding protein [Verrucomicrobium sp. GAS474]SDT85785.1 ATP-binding cassette, subfamily B [Verrucomicrobium sp. GAS474]
MPHSTDALLRSPEAPELPVDPFRFLLRFVKRYRGWYVAICALETGAAVGAIFAAATIGQVVKALGHAAGGEGFGVLLGPCLAFAGYNAAEVVLTRVAGACRMRSMPYLRTSVTRELYAYLQCHSHRFLNDNFAGALAHRIAETSQGTGMAMGMILFDFLPIVVKIAVSVVLLSFASGLLATFLGVWAVLFLGLSWIFARKCRLLARRHAAARSEMTGKLVDSVTNLSSVRLFARLGFERTYLDGYLDAEVAAGRKAFGYMERVLWFQYAASFVLKAGLLFLAAFLWRTGRIDVACFVGAVSMALLIIGELRNLARRLMEFFEFLGNIANGVQSIVRSHEVVDREGAPALRVTRGGIVFRDVGFSYGGEKGGRRVFDGLNLVIEPRQRVGLVGFSGSGKSSLLNLVLRLYDPQEGAVLIDGKDIREVSQSSLHSQIGFIPQDPGLFHRTLRENIGYGSPGIGEEAIRRAAVLAHADGFIEGMRDEYDSLVGERGVKLSGGQRQRIAIARVVAKDAPILIMDEATSSLDSLTERAIQESLDAMMKDRTVLVVAHRLSTIAHLDRILVFDSGRIVEDGGHRELLARDGAYARLWNSQINGFLPEEDEKAVSLEAV